MKAQNTSRRLRIALVPPLWAQVAPATKGGVEYIVYLLAEELVKRCHEVTVFTSSDSPTSARIDALCEWNMIEAMERNRAWEYEYYETCNIAETLQKSDSFDVIHFHVGCYAIPLGVLSRAPALHTLHNPITPDAIWLLGRYANAPVTAVSRQQIAEVRDHKCMGCQVMLRPQTYNEVRNGEKVMICESCSRVYYFNAANEAPPEQDPDHEP